MVTSHERLDSPADYLFSEFVQSMTDPSFIAMHSTFRSEIDFAIHIAFIFD